MVIADSHPDVAISPAITDGVKQALEKTFATICGEKPIERVNGQPIGSGPYVVGIISFFGDVPWSLSWILHQDTAPAVMQKFVGMEIAFDDPDMGDAVGELVNVLAGDVVAQLEQRGVKAQMSLPTVARGSPLELIPDKGAAAVELGYTSPQGDFWLRITAPKPSQFRARVPGT
jgi:CheY-specific phosphatase CheX